MDPQRRFDLTEKDKVYSVSIGAAADDMEQIYYTTPEEAVLSIFHASPNHWTKSNVSGADFQLRIYAVRNPLTIRDRAPFDMQQVVTAGDPNEQSFGLRLGNTCPVEQVAGFYVEIPLSMPQFVDDNDILVTEQAPSTSLTGLVLCTRAALLLVRQLRLDAETLIHRIVQRVDLFRTQGQQLTFRKLSEMLRHTLAERQAEYLELISLDVTPATQFPGPQASPTGLTAGLPWFLGSASQMAASQSMSPVVSPQAAISDPAMLDRLPRDVLIYMAKGFSLNSITAFCRTSPRFNEAVCTNERFWIGKFLTDFSQTELDLKPADLSYKDYYRRVWERTFDPDSLRTRLGRINKGFSTIQLIGILLTFSSKNNEGGIPTPKAIVDALSKTSGLQLHSTLQRYDNWFADNSLPGQPSFYSARHPNMYAPRNGEGAHMLSLRGKIYDAVAAMSKNPSIMQRFDSPRTFNVGGVPHNTNPWNNFAKLLAGTGARGPFDPNAPAGPNKLYTAEFYRAAFMKIWSLTKRDEEPPHVRAP